MKIKSLALFCGSKKGNSAVYAQHAHEVGELLAAQKVGLVYGGGNNGLMGVAADAAMAGGGRVQGVIPQVLLAWEQQHEGISELLIVEDMHVRKRKLYELCDGALILPGGFGTLDELFEILTWNGLSIHDKKIFILNSGGFYTHLLLHMELLEKEGFLYGELRDKFVVLTEPAGLLPYLQGVL
ncbi:MAG: TIGR00730 family Rossman fold protein [Chitinophagaceae bacterium]